MTTTTRRATVTVLGAVAVAGTALAGSGAGTATASAADTNAVGSSSSGKTASLVFDKNSKAPNKSELRLTIRKNGKTIKSLRYRSGSGNGSTNPCATGKGWLPNGRYNMKLWSNYQGSIVKGRAFQLDDKACGNGKTTRTELFIHTSKPWTEKRYFSEACVKLTPGNIDQLYRSVHYHFPSVKNGGKLPFQLTVTS